jgi:hypothetical protein
VEPEIRPPGHFTGRDELADSLLASLIVNFNGGEDLTEQRQLIGRKGRVDPKPVPTGRGRRHGLRHSPLDRGVKGLRIDRQSEVAVATCKPMPT